MLLNCHTFYSFGYGTTSVESLLAQLKRGGHDMFCLTDINNTSACLDAIRLSKLAGIKCCIGVDFRNGISQQYVAIAINNAGFKEINEHLSYHLHRDEDFSREAPEFQHVHVVYPYKNAPSRTLGPNEWVGITAQELTQTSLSTSLHRNKMVVLQTITFTEKKFFNAHRLLRAIHENTLLSKLTLEQQSPETATMKSIAELEQAFAHFPEFINNTLHILAQCEVDFTYGKLANKNLKYYTDSLGSDMQLLRNQCAEGLHYRYPNPSEQVLCRLNKELEVIEQLKFASYYLINWDIVSYARSKNYYYVGRGSGANSLIAYLLRITDVDPIELDLYFERFINIYRENAPDFDIDFSWTDRDDITRYIFDRFGRERTALLGAYNTFQHDAVIRELGKVFGLPAGEIDKLQQAHRYKDIDGLGKLVLQYSEVIKGFPSHLSIHSSGIIISEEPISTYTATSMPPKGYPTTQFSMLEAEDIGLYKFDILSQRGLGKIKDALQLIQQNQHVEIDIHDTAKFKKDEEVKSLLRVGRTIGCFYVESPAMRVLLAKLKADDYLRLVAASSIIRPGVSKSGMMREYIVRYNDVSRREAARAQLPELYDLLEETYGVMVYQEDVIKVAHFFAGLSLADADHLRRGMSWKFKQRSDFWKVKDNFFNNCLKKGYDESKVNEIWVQIESFANYAFSKGHSASYAVESYQALYLKAYFPLEYMAATVNNGGGFYQRSLYLHEARMHGAEIELPSVNLSDVLCTIYGKKIYLGFSLIAGLESNTMKSILLERHQNGPFRDLQQFMKRVQISQEQLHLLIKAGGFNFTERNKRELLWEARAFIKGESKKPKAKELFESPSKSWVMPRLNHNRIDEAFDQMELFGFTFFSPFDLLKDPIPNAAKASDLANNIGKEITALGYLVTTKNTRTSKGERMHFGTFLDITGHWLDTVHFPDAAKQYPFVGSGCYLLHGVVMDEFGALSIRVSSMKHLDMFDKDALVDPYNAEVNEA